MLTALENGVKGGIWFSLIDKVYSPTNLYASYAKVAATEGFEFLGYRFVKHRRFPRRKSVAKFREAIRGKTRRSNGRSLNMIIADVNRTLRGWFEYFQHSHPTVFPGLDGWVRMRLRSILRKRSGRRGRGHGADHHRWPNAYFAEHGLFNLQGAHALACQSSRR